MTTVRSGKKRKRGSLGLIGSLMARIKRPLPDFLIIGAQKAGTSSLYAYLVQHPQILSAARKEVHYFSTEYDRGAAWYRQQFPRTAKINNRSRRLGKPVLTGEASPYYLFHPHAPQRIAKLLPDVKLILLLRDPVSRAYSHYRHEVKLRTETLPFAEAIKRESERIDEALRQMRADERVNSFAHQHYSYVSRGAYIDQLLAFERHFSRDRMFISTSDEFFNDPQTVYGQVLGFLGVDVLPLKDAAPRNVGSYERKSRIELQDELEAHFRPLNRRLYDHLGRDLGWPADPPATIHIETAARIREAVS
jgi:hypothetical protein